LTICFAFNIIPLNNTYKKGDNLMLMSIVGTVSSILGFSLFFVGLKLIRPDVERLAKLPNKTDSITKIRLERDCRHDLYYIIWGALAIAVGFALVTAGLVMKS
jgi:hypothetical protein